MASGWLRWLSFSCVALVDGLCAFWLSFMVVRFASITGSTHWI